MLMMNRNTMVGALLALALALPLVVQAGQALWGEARDDERTFLADLSQVEHGSYEVQFIVVPGPDGEPVPLAIREHDLFAPGQKKVQYMDEDGNVREEPLLVWTYKGRVVGDDDSHVALTFDTAGFRGAIRTGDLRITFQPAAPDTPMGEDRQAWTVARYVGDAIAFGPPPCDADGIYDIPDDTECKAYRDVPLPPDGHEHH